MDSCISQPQALASRFPGAPPVPQFFVDLGGRRLGPFSVLCTFAFRLLSPMLLFLWWLKTPPFHHLHFLLRPYAPALGPWSAGWISSVSTLVQFSNESFLPTFHPLSLGEDSSLPCFTAGFRVHGDFVPLYQLEMQLVFDMPLRGHLSGLWLPKCSCALWRLLQCSCGCLILDWLVWFSCCVPPVSLMPGLPSSLPSVVLLLLFLCPLLPSCFIKNREQCSI